MPTTIRRLDPVADLDAVAAFYTRAADYWLLADRKAPDRQKARDYFTDGPPGCDPATSYRLGMFGGADLIGVAELSFGFPLAEDAYLGLMLLDPDARGQGHGAAFLAQVEALACSRHCARLYLAVLEENLAGRRFWIARGFERTGFFRDDAATGHRIHRLVKAL